MWWHNQMWCTQPNVMKSEEKRYQGNRSLYATKRDEICRETLPRNSGCADNLRPNWLDQINWYRSKLAPAVHSQHPVYGAQDIQSPSDVLVSPCWLIISVERGMPSGLLPAARKEHGSKATCGGHILGGVGLLFTKPKLGALTGISPFGRLKGGALCL